MSEFANFGKRMFLSAYLDYGSRSSLSIDAGRNFRTGSRRNHFSHTREAVALANNTRYGLAASIWTENINLALDLAPKIICGVAWINSTNQFDASAGFGGRRESGFGREGGWEGLYAYAQSIHQADEPLARITAREGTSEPSDPGIDRTPKLFIGGKQARPDSGYSYPVFPIMEKKWALLGKETEKMSEMRWRRPMQLVHGVNQPPIFELKSFIT